jgi:hypothetical protein
MNHLLPIFVATLIPSIMALLGIGSLGFSAVNTTGPLFFLMFSIPITLLHVATYVPLAIVIERKFGLNLIKFACLGFLVGCFYIGIHQWPYPDGSYIGEVEAQFMGNNIIKSVNGYPTIWGWLMYLKLVLTVGLVFGVPAGLGYGLSYKKA